MEAAVVNEPARKRSRRHGEPAARPVKRPRQGPEGDRSSRRRSDAVEDALLSRLYPNLTTLRSYALSKLPSSSRLRRKKISAVGLQDAAADGPRPCRDVESALSRLLDTTLVGSSESPLPTRDNRWEQWVSFSQRGDESYATLSDGSAGAALSQREIVDFVVWLLFSREKKGTNGRPNHILCDGFRRDVNARPQGAALGRATEIPGLFTLYTNHQAQALKAAPWPELLVLLGKSGQQIMMDLLLDCAIFTKVEAGRNNYCQLSGMPVSELDSYPSSPKIPGRVSPRLTGRTAASEPACRSPSTIAFSRSRMLYARAALNAHGLVHFGLRHIHVLNRFPLKKQAASDASSSAKGAAGDAAGSCGEATLRVMMYMFPRQFGLHSVFLSDVDRSSTSQKFQDYTMREEEISKRFIVASDGELRFKAKLPKRLRGATQRLVERLQVLHARCSYSKLLEHYCPAPGRPSAHRRGRPGNSVGDANKSSPVSTRRPRGKPRQMLASSQPPEYSSLTDLATPAAHVSAFCQAALSNIIPGDFWGSGSTRDENKAVFLKNVDRFLHLRRFEQLSLHDAMQGLKVVDVEWLAPPGLRSRKCSQTDTAKRFEIFREFLYYLFDSLLIPLIRSNFYVTESSAHRSRLFFFRHDVWRHVAEPAMASLKARLFEEVSTGDALAILESRRLGFSHVRLLPKGAAVRPIMNLRRRALARGGGKVLGPSINTVLGPVSSVLKHEMRTNPSLLGSAMFSVGDIYQRLKQYKATVGGGPFYFAKVDVQSAFDTIPQDAVIDMVGRVMSQPRYKVAKHVEVRAGDAARGAGPRGKLRKKWQSMAKPADDQTAFAQVLEDQLAPNREGTVFVESVLRRSYDKRALMALTTSHIQQNVVKIGKKYYRQKNGIPQGSVLSASLCNYFYADLERNRLPFVQADDCLLLRLIDDFLLITTDKAKARLFVRTMLRGIPEYGVAVNPGKSLANFSMAVDGIGVPRSADGQSFPYCGTMIDCKTLEMTKNRENASDSGVFDSLTVEFSRCPGQNFTRKTLNAFKIQSHLMFFDTAHNSRRTTLSNIYRAFLETATKAWAYARCLPKGRRPPSRLMTSTIEHLIGFSFLLLTSKSRASRYPGYQCRVNKPQVAWLALAAFKQVLSRKQAGYRDVIVWLERQLAEVSGREKIDCTALAAVARAP